MAQIHSLYIFYYQIAIYKTKILRIAEVKGIQNNEVGKRGLCKNCVSNKRFRPFKSIYKKYLNWGYLGSILIGEKIGGIRVRLQSVKILKK